MRRDNPSSTHLNSTTGSEMRETSNSNSHSLLTHSRISIEYSIVQVGFSIQKVHLVIWEVWMDRMESMLQPQHLQTPMGVGSDRFTGICQTSTSPKCSTTEALKTLKTILSSTLWTLPITFHRISDHLAISPISLIWFKECRKCRKETHHIQPQKMYWRVYQSSR